MDIIRRRHCRKLFKRCLRVVTTALINEILEFVDDNNEKRIWVREWLKRRTALEAGENLLTELALEDPEEYRLCLRMTPENFEHLLSLVSPSIRKRDTILRDSIPARIKLQITLNFLATGNSYRTLQHFFRVSKPAISKFVPEVCDAIYQALEQYIKAHTSATHDCLDDAERNVLDLFAENQVLKQRIKRLNSILKMYSDHPQAAEYLKKYDIK